MLLAGVGDINSDNENDNEEAKDNVDSQRT